MEPKMIQIGKLTIALQALLVFILGLVVSLSILVLFPNLYGLIGAIGIMVPFGIATYLVNCTIVGKCILFSWILVGMYVLMAMIMILRFMSLKQMLRMINKKK